ncbi:MAG TPA: septation protein SepH [Actinomycetota bacterium]|nr:septation protein SepH [Actinomycetota bacterium]
MIRLHLVGFTTDLKNLIFGNEPGATSGGYVVSIDARLRRTLEEVARMEEEALAGVDLTTPSEEPPVEEEPLEEEEEVAEAPVPPKRVRAFEDVHSKLTPKEIQALVRQGKSEEQVARLAQTDVAWVRRFTFPILAERAGVIEAVRSARLSKPRLGPSALNIGEAVEENLGARHLRSPREVDESWKAVRKNGRWHVSFEFPSGGKRRSARFSFDPETRQVDALNDVAIEIGYKAGPRSRPGGARPSTGGSRSPAHEPASDARHKPRSPKGGLPPSTGTDARSRPTSPPKPSGTRGRGPASR